MPSGRKTMASLRSKIFGSDGIIRYFSNGISNTATRVLGRPISQQLQVILKKRKKQLHKNVKLLMYWMSLLFFFKRRYKSCQLCFHTDINVIKHNVRYIYNVSIYAKYLCQIFNNVFFRTCNLTDQKKNGNAAKVLQFHWHDPFLLFYILGIGSVNVLIISFLTKKITQK